MHLAPDALTPLGGYPGTDDEGRELQRKRDRNEMLEDFIAAYEHLKNHPECTGKVGVVGFCFGGTGAYNYHRFGRVETFRYPLANIHSIQAFHQQTS